ncbi:FKBP-type peptidyl-prolyl cis-trans isomerase [Streptomyces sp. NPDC059851]|uniref:FKBP-type peptidyl-prolyl cis-trans isomerase n=1 Tax=Streptomyces sp. NPDC059851 TaxID=3346971 RepID=UPI003658F2CB
MSDKLEKPEIDFPEGPAPKDLEIVDIWEGDGPVAEAGQKVSVHYVGVAFSTGEEFDASWNRGAPLPFILGIGQVIEGWDKGVQGMKVGGRRKLTIPAHLAYGDHSPTPAIQPGETLIFVCDLMGVG